MRFEAGVAWDSNPFLSPVQSYYDQNADRVVDPSATSGFFTPVELDGMLRTRRSFVDYYVQGDLYPDTATRNAENFELRVAPGLQFEFGDKNDGHFKLGPFAGQSKKIFFDRDTGLAGESGGVDISDRFTYRSFGGEFELEAEAGRALEFALQGLVERRDYEDVQGVSSFDHDLAEIGAEMTVRLGKPTALRLGYSRQMRSYSDRTARDLAGESDDANPLLDYSYDRIKLGLHLRPNRRWRLRLEWDQTERTDAFLGYNDYSQDRIRMRTSIRADRYKLTLYGTHRERSAQAAFIFDRPLSSLDGTPNPHKSETELEFGAESVIEFNHFHLVIGAESSDQESADPRFAYERWRTMIGGRWVFRSGQDR